MPTIVAPARRGEERGGGSGASRPGAAQSGESPPSEAAPPRRRRRRLLLLLPLIAVLAAAVVLIGPRLLGAGKSHASGRPAARAPGVMVGLPTLTTNLDDGHLVQFRLDLQLAPGVAATAVTSEEPRIADAEISVMGRWSMPAILAPGGRSRALSELLGRIRQIVGAHVVVAAYYTEFVAQ